MSLQHELPQTTVRAHTKDLWRLASDDTFKN